VSDPTIRNDAPRRWTGFPETVNDTAARTVAAVVAIVAWSIVLFDLPWLVVVLVYGFIARVVAGPRYSPLAQFASRVVAPKLGGKIVAGPPKRFAQAMGVGFSVTGAVLFLAGFDTAARVVLAMLAVAATLESVFGLCLGCKIFAFGMRVGVVPERVCVQCANLELSTSSPR
jgi:hypothetical protein